MEVVEFFTHRQNTFEKIQWYIILSLNDKYFFNFIETSEYDPVFSKEIQNGNITPLKVEHIDNIIETCKNTINKYKYDRLILIKMKLNRDSKINNILNE
jgi:hypothetical protein